MPQKYDWSSLPDPGGATSAPRVPAFDFSQLPDQAPPQPQGSALGRFVGGAAEMLNPITMAEGMYQAVRHLPTTAANVYESHVGQAQKAFENFGQGRYSEALGHGAAALLPLVGPAAANIGEELGKGDDIAGNLGRGVGLAAGVVAPGMVAKAVPKAVGPLMRNPNPLAQEAIAAGRAAGVPIDAATATGSSAVRNVQQGVGKMIGGSGVTRRAGEAQAQGLATMGEQLAAKGYGSSVTPELAGQGVREAVGNTVKGFADEADAAYGTLRKIEADPKFATVVKAADGSSELVPMAVDVKSVKNQMQGVYKDLLRQSELTPLQGDKGRALVALDRLMQAPDAAPLSVVDGALGDLKAFVRKAEGAPLSAGQGSIQGAVKYLDAQVRAAAAKAGPDAVKALEAGRKATIEKYGAADVLDALKAEPVGSFKAATRAGDAAIEHLRDVQKYAPAELPKIGRAVLDDMLGRATADGGFAHGAKIASEWDKLGAQTKALMFKDPGYIKDLDNFFRLAKMTAEVANPSGTAGQVGVLSQAAAVGAAVARFDPLSAVASVAGPYSIAKFLHSPTGVKFLTRGFKIPLANKAAQAAYTGEIANLAQQMGATSPSGLQTLPAGAR